MVEMGGGAVLMFSDNYPPPPPAAMKLIKGHGEHREIKAHRNRKAGGGGGHVARSEVLVYVQATRASYIKNAKPSALAPPSYLCSQRKH
jgi:hypothetical protein